MTRREKFQLQKKSLDQKIKMLEEQLKRALEGRPQVLWATKNKAAELYNCSVRSIYDWHAKGKLISKEINNRRYYSITPLLMP